MPFAAKDERRPPRGLNPLPPGHPHPYPDTHIQLLLIIFPHFFGLKNSQPTFFTKTNLFMRKRL